MADKMPSSVKLGARPISLRMRSYSSGFRPCSATRRGVTTVWSRVIGEPARLLTFLSVDMVPPRSRGGRPDLCGRPRLQGRHEVQSAEGQDEKPGHDEVDRAHAIRLVVSTYKRLRPNAIAADFQRKLCAPLRRAMRSQPWAPLGLGLAG